jgi:hypothetical protein
MEDQADNFNQAEQDSRHHGHRIRVRRKRKGGIKKGARLNLIQVLITLVVGLIVALYIINQNQGSNPSPPSASLKHQATPSS